MKAVPLYFVSEAAASDISLFAMPLLQATAFTSMPSCTLIAPQYTVARAAALLLDPFAVEPRLQVRRLVWGMSFVIRGSQRADEEGENAAKARAVRRCHAG
ncbi:MAG: hypothetical protein ABI318_13025 [Chthoniobacteraceae bacterium]